MTWLSNSNEGHVDTNKPLMCRNYISYAFAQKYALFPFSNSGNDLKCWFFKRQILTRRSEWNSVQIQFITTLLRILYLQRQRTVGIFYIYNGILDVLAKVFLITLIKVCNFHSCIIMLGSQIFLLLQMALHPGYLFVLAFTAIFSVGILKY